MTLLMCKLGCNQLANTYSIEKGGMSVRQARRYLANGVIPNFKTRLTNSFDGLWRQTIEKNMEDVISSGIFDKMLNDGNKRAVAMLVDGIAVEERANLDVSQLPHQITGLCHHAKTTNFVNFQDIQQIEIDLDRIGNDPSKIHFAKETEVYYLGVNDKNIHSLC